MVNSLPVRTLTFTQHEPLSDMHLSLQKTAVFGKAINAIKGVKAVKPTTLSMAVPKPSVIPVSVPAPTPVFLKTTGVPKARALSDTVIASPALPATPAPKPASTTTTTITAPQPVPTTTTTPSVARSSLLSRTLRAPARYANSRTAALGNYASRHPVKMLGLTGGAMGATYLGAQYAKAPIHQALKYQEEAPHVLGNQMWVRPYDHIRANTINPEKFERDYAALPSSIPADDTGAGMDKERYLQKMRVRLLADDYYAKMYGPYSAGFAKNIEGTFASPQTLFVPPAITLRGADTMVENTASKQPKFNDRGDPILTPYGQNILSHELRHTTQSAPDRSGVDFKGYDGTPEQHAKYMNTPHDLGVRVAAFKNLNDPESFRRVVNNLSPDLEPFIKMLPASEEARIEYLLDEAKFKSLIPPTYDPAAVDRLNEIRKKVLNHNSDSKQLYDFYEGLPPEERVKYLQKIRQTYGRVASAPQQTQPGLKMAQYRTAINGNFYRNTTQLGYYTTSNSSKKELLSLMKRASVGGDTESNFEQSFGALAYSYVKDKAPRLLDYIIGFQLVDRNEDSTKAMGVFGYKAGDNWYYGPVFFLNGDLKGHELLYIKSDDMFVPLKENWVNYLIARKPNELGKGTKKTTRELGTGVPQARNMYGVSKYAAENIEVQAWSLPFVSMMAKAKFNPSFPFEKFANLNQRLDLSNHLDSLEKIAFVFDEVYMKYPVIKQGFDRFYGTNFFENQILKHKDRFEKEAFDKEADSYILPSNFMNKKKTFRSAIEDLEDYTKEEKKAEVRVILQRMIISSPKKAYDDDEDEDDEDSELDETDSELESALSEMFDKKAYAHLDSKQREKLFQNQYLVIDFRPLEKVSQAYEEESTVKFQTPTENGLYEIVLKNGDFEKVLVVGNLATPLNQTQGYAIAKKKDSGKYVLIAKHLLHSKLEESINDDWSDYYKSLPEASSIENGGHYAAVCHGTGGTMPFHVYGKDGDILEVNFIRRPSVGSDSPDQRGEWGMYEAHRHDMDEGPESFSSVFVKLVDSKANKIRIQGDHVFIPKSMKVVKLEDRYSNSEDLYPGTPEDFKSLLQKEAKISIHKYNTDTYQINSVVGRHTFNKLAALKNLIECHGLDEAQSLEMLKQANDYAPRNKAKTWIIKYAGPQLEEGPEAPAMPEPEYYSETGPRGSGYAVQPMLEEVQRIPGLEGQDNDPSLNEPSYEPDQGAMQSAQNAANAGQKEVFDTSMLATMLKSVSQTSDIDQDLGDLMKALDKLGRQLMMIYWHAEDYEERYGREDMPELEDSVRNNFDNLGDLCLFLKEKTVKGRSGVLLPSVGNTSDANIDSSARN